MNVEVLKLKEVQLAPNRRGQVMAIEDFHRLIVTYKLTLQGFLDMGLSRSLWDNTLLYHSLDVNTIQGLRLQTTTKHLSAKAGFTTTIPIKNLHLSSKLSKSKIDTYLTHLEKFFPGTIDIYSKYHTSPLEVNKYFNDIKREVLDINEAIKSVNRRVTKWGKHNNLPTISIIHSKLEHHFAKILDELDLSYYPQFPIGKYKFDFYLAKYNLIIEIDGGAHNTKNDKLKTRLVRVGGYKLLRLRIESTLTLKQDYEDIKRRILRETLSV